MLIVSLKLYIGTIIAAFHRIIDKCTRVHIFIDHHIIIIIIYFKIIILIILKLILAKDKLNLM